MKREEVCFAAKERGLGRDLTAIAGTRLESAGVQLIRFETSRQWVRHRAKQGQCLMFRMTVARRWQNPDFLCQAVNTKRSSSVDRA